MAYWRVRNHHISHLDVDFVPRKSPEDHELLALHVQAEVVDGGQAESQQDAVQWQTLPTNQSF